MYFNELTLEINEHQKKNVVYMKSAKYFNQNDTIAKF